jgi:hypothetical protein
MQQPIKLRFSTREASAYTGVPAATLRKFRWEGRGPAYSKPAGRALYHIADLDSWLESGRRVPSVRASKETERHVPI